DPAAGNAYDSPHGTLVSWAAVPAEPAPHGPPPVPAIDSGLDEPISRARALAGGARLALILGGSHASGEAVWAEAGGRRVALSDLDLYAVLPDERACHEAERRAANEARAPRAASAVPLEIGFLTPGGLGRM